MSADAEQTRTSGHVEMIPRAHTPSGGYEGDMPAPILAGCPDPILPGAPDLRGTWRVIEAESDGERLSADAGVWNHVERIEQAAHRVVVTGGGVVHDMYADGTYDNGVNDVMAADHMTPLVVAATFENGALVLRPRDLPGVEVLRWREGEDLVWRYHTLFTARLERIQRSPLG